MCFFLTELLTAHVTVFSVLNSNYFAIITYKLGTYTYCVQYAYCDKLSFTDLTVADLS